MNVKNLKISRRNYTKINKHLNSRNDKIFLSSSMIF